MQQPVECQGRGQWLAFAVVRAHVEKDLAVGVVRREPVGEAYRQGGFADARHPVDGQDGDGCGVPLVDHRRKALEFGIPTGEGVQIARQVAGRGARHPAPGRHQSGVADEDPAVQFAQFGVRGRAQFDGKLLTDPFVDPQRLPRPPAAVQRQHQQLDRLLVARKPVDQSVQFHDELRVVTLVEFEPGPVDRGAEQLFLHVAAPPLRPLAGDTAERIAAPKAHRLVEEPHRLVRVAAGRYGAGLVAQRPEAVVIDGIGIDFQHIGTRRLFKPHFFPERLKAAPEPGHVGVEEILRPCRSVGAPRPVDQHFGVDRPPGSHQEDGEDAAFLCPAQMQTLPIRPQFHRAEDAEFHPHSQGKPILTPMILALSSENFH